MPSGDKREANFPDPAVDGRRRGARSIQQGELDQLPRVEAEFADDPEWEGHSCPAGEAPPAGLEPLSANLDGYRDTLAERQRTGRQEHLGVGAAAVSLEDEPFPQGGGHAGEGTGGTDWR